MALIELPNGSTWTTLLDRINTETYMDTKYDTYNYVYKTIFSYKNPLNSPSAFIIQSVSNILSKELK